MGDTPAFKTPGERLGAARRDRGLTLEQLAGITKIPQRLLEAVERDEYHKISGSIYVRSFLRAYAESVGLDPHDIVSDYEQHAGRREPAETEQVWEEDRAAVQAVGIPYGRILLRYVLPVVIVIVVVVVALWLRGRPVEPARDGERGAASLLADEGAIADSATAVAAPDSAALVASPSDSTAASAADSAVNATARGPGDGS
jgi:cytoskeletal protein RodZ